MISLRRPRPTPSFRPTRSLSERWTGLTCISGSERVCLDAQFEAVGKLGFRQRRFGEPLGLSFALPDKPSGPPYHRSVMSVEAFFDPSGAPATELLRHSAEAKNKWLLSADRVSSRSAGQETVTLRAELC